MDSRLSEHEALGARLAAMPDDELRGRLEAVEGPTGWDTSRTISVGGRSVFAKAVPVTARELAAGPTTRNLFGLPTFYSYGVGSAGFGVWRELDVHQRTTGWVRDGAHGGFPLLHHHRVLALPGQARPMAPEELDRYVAYWDGSEAVRAFRQARQGATHAVVLCLEFVPHALRDWITEHAEALPSVLQGVQTTTGFLRSQGIVHFDVHLGNVLTDGEQTWLTDFGLALDEGWELDDDERAFHKAHRHYDDAEFITCLYRPLKDRVGRWSDPERARATALVGGVELPDVVDGLEELRRAGLIDLPAAAAELLVRQEPLRRWMGGFFDRLRAGPGKDGGYDDAVALALLESTGALRASGAGASPGPR